LLWPFGDLVKKFARLPFIGKKVAQILWNEKNLEATYIPVDENIEIPSSNALPMEFIEELARIACERFILSYCLCRASRKCKNYPKEIGCVFLGEAAGEIDKRYGRRASIEEVLEHARAATSIGLIPCVIHGKFDASLFGIDYRKMLAICFCDDCCCTLRTDMRKGPLEYRDRIQRFEGLKLEAGENCDACGKCAEACFLDAISIGEKGPSFAEWCKGCGRCVSVCPHQNIKLVFNPPSHIKEEFLAKISKRTDIT